MEKKYVWEFTNTRKLTKKEFLNYFEKKVFRTIRKYNMLPKNKTILLKSSDSLNYNVLRSVLEKKFLVKDSKKPNFSDESCSDVSEKVFENILKGVFSGPKPKDGFSRPFYFHSDKEIELYSRLKNISGKKKKRNKRIQELFLGFMKKNPDLELNIVGALGQIKENEK